MSAPSLSQNTPAVARPSPWQHMYNPSRDVSVLTNSSIGSLLRIFGSCAPPTAALCDQCGLNPCVALFHENVLVRPCCQGMSVVEYSLIEETMVLAMGSHADWSDTCVAVPSQPPLVLSE